MPYRHASTLHTLLPSRPATTDAEGMRAYCYRQTGNCICDNIPPRTVDHPPRAIAITRDHSDIESDEVMLYCGSDFAALRESDTSAGSVRLPSSAGRNEPGPRA